MRKVCFITAGAICLLFSCSKDTPPIGDGLLVTTLQVITINLSDTSQRDTFQYIDYDAVGPNPAYKTDSIQLHAQTEYSIRILPMNQSQLPYIDYTSHVASAGNHYLMVTVPTPADSFLRVRMMDVDSNLLPIGLTQRWQTFQSGTGKLSVKLRYQPAMKNGTETPGLSDAEAVFPVLVY